MLHSLFIHAVEILFAGVVLYLFLAIGATYLLVHPPRIHGNYTPKSYGIPFRPVSFFSSGGKVKLAGWHMRHDENARGLVIFCHGLGAGKADFLPLAAFFFRNNFDCLLFDFRAHGDSEGFFSTTGFEEIGDVLGALEFVDANHLTPDGRSIVLGTSMGAAASLQAAAQSRKVALLVSDSAFADGYQLLRESFEIYFHGLPRKYFYRTCRFLLEKLGRLPQPIKQPAEAAAELKIPVLFLHGEADLSIPPHHVSDLMKSCASPQKEMWIFQGMGHVEAYQQQVELYQQKVLDFVERHLEPAAAPRHSAKPHPNGVMEVAAGVVVEDGKVLVTRRAKGAHLEGLWEFPGGKLMPGEPPQMGVIREIREEVDLEVIVENLIAKVEYAYPDKKAQIHFFKCRILSGKAKPIACAEMRWINKEELERLPFPPANAPVLPKVKGLLQPGI